MRSLRKQLKLLSSLAETILQHRLNAYPGLNQHLCEIRKKIRHMNLTHSYQEGISEMLVSKENYQIRNKISKFEGQQQSEKHSQIIIQIRITAIEKCSGQKYNQQLWEFGVRLNQISHLPQHYSQSHSTVELIEYVLRYLMCYSILPLNKQHRNKYMLDYKVTIGAQPEPVDLFDFGNMSAQEIMLSKTQEGNICRLHTKYFFNERKVQQSLKQIIISKTMQTSGYSKKNSLDTDYTSKRVSLYQYYDDELDITVLSGSDFSSQNGEEIELELQALQEEQQDEEFQMLIEQTQNQEDEIFLKNNISLFKQLNSQQDDYF